MRSCAREDDGAYLEESGSVHIHRSAKLFTGEYPKLWKNGKTSTV